MANFASGVLNAKIWDVSLLSRTASPRETCQPTSSTGSPLRTTMRAASGSTQMLYSAQGVTFTSQQGAPPMITQRPTLAAIPGFLESANARLVSGASVTITIPGFALTAAIIASTA